MAIHPRQACGTHGGAVIDGVCITDIVLDYVRQERKRQFSQYGSNSGLEDGTGRDARWLSPVSDMLPEDIETEFRWDYESHKTRTGAPTWMHLVREEVAEAFMESDQVRLREELIQVAALCVSWVEKIEERKL